MPTIYSLKNRAKELNLISTTPVVDLEILLAHTLNKNREFLYAHPEYELTTAEYQHFMTLFAQRYQGKPIAYLLGKKEFWSLELIVNESVLIPRPETELLVELTLQYITTKTALVADIGTGSGAIALALASEQPNWKIIATDNSQAALQVARRNQKKLLLPNIEFICGDLVATLPNAKFNAIISNPPYISTSDPHLQQGDLRFEPKTALCSSTTGLDHLTKIITAAAARLAPEGWLILEHGFDQAQEVTKLLQQNHYTSIKTFQDFAGNNRATIALK